MKGRPFRPIPDPGGLLVPPPRKPPAAVAAEASPPPAPSGHGARAGRRRARVRRMRRAAHAMGNLSRALLRMAGRLERSLRHAVRG